MNKTPLVSVNIRTFNSGKTLDQTLESVKSQTYKNIEIVVSDGHSRDDSLKIAKKFNAKIDYSDNLGDARHQNYLNSKGKFILSLDSDQMMDSKLVEECVRLCGDQGYDALIISERSLPNKKNYLESLISYDKWLIDQTKDTDAVFGTTCPRFFRRDILGDVQWPKGLGIFDDTILYSQLIKKDAKIKYVSSQSIRHNEVDSWQVLIRKFFRYGKSYPTTFKQKPATIAAHSLPRRAYFTRIAFSQPKYFLGLPLLYGVKATTAFCGVIYSLIYNLFNKI